MTRGLGLDDPIIKVQMLWGVIIGNQSIFLEAVKMTPWVQVPAPQVYSSSLVTQEKSQNSQ